MGKGRTLFAATVVAAVTELVATARSRELRRAAFERVRAGVSRRGGITAFADTPCSRESLAAGAACRSGGQPTDEDAHAQATAGAPN